MKTNTSTLEQLALIKKQVIKAYQDCNNNKDIAVPELLGLFLKLRSIGQKQYGDKFYYPFVSATKYPDEAMGNGKIKNLQITVIASFEELLKVIDSTTKDIKAKQND